MSQRPERKEGPCLHCMMVELIEDFFRCILCHQVVSNKIDPGDADEVIFAVAEAQN